MGYRGTEGSRTPPDWQSQRSGRPRSYSAGAALEPADGGPGTPGAPDDAAGDDEAGYGSGEWAADLGADDYGADATQGHGAASRGPARGFPPAPGQPDPVYPQDDFDAWSDGTGARGGQAGAHQGQAHQGQGDSPAAGGPWDAAPVGQWESTGHQSEQWEPTGHQGDQWESTGHQSEHWEPSHQGDQWEPTGHQSEHWNQGEHWDQEVGAAPQPWGEGSGQWDAPYGRWDESGEWHGPDERDGERHSPEEHDADDGGQERNSHHAGGYDRADFAIAGRDADRWDAADYPAYGGYPDETEPGGEENGGRRNRRRRGGHGRTGTAVPPPPDAAPGGFGGSGAPGGSGGRARGVARRAARGSRTRTIVAGATVVVIAALAALAYTLLTSHSRHSGAAAGSSPGITVPKLPTPTASGSLGTSGASRLGKWGFITSRATDAAPLTVAELYPAQFLINGSSFRTTDRADTDCNQALFGTQLQNAAKVYGCSQVVRASYISGSQTMMGTIGVVNLSSANDAAKAGNASGANDFVTPLDGKTGPTRNLSQGTGVVQAEYKGHYLILIWAEFANLKAPSTATQRTQLEQFASGLISGSANIALSNRMVSGHPEVTGTPG